MFEVIDSVSCAWLFVAATNAKKRPFENLARRSSEASCAVKDAYALSAASLTVLIRLFASAPEGVGYSILLANLITPVLDHHKVASSRWTWKKWLTVGLILLADILFIVIGIIFGGKVK